MKLFKRIYVGYSAALVVLCGVISGQRLRALISWNMEWGVVWVKRESVANMDPPTIKPGGGGGGGY